ncbi:MAG: hypothetical protein JSV86_09360 [Gemmatimonadota bacterium]|nr:MAG: hypothetical protein JSV86_09360 [Gemmatimonadota bacterium]
MHDSEKSRVVLLVGTRKGLFRATSGLGRREWRLDRPYLAGYELYHACFDRRDVTTAYAAANHAVWGVHVHRSTDGGRTWELLPGAPHYPPAEDAPSLKAIWYLAPGHASAPEMLYAGIEPAGLFVSRNRGASWQSVAGLNRHPTRHTWQPAKGGLALHSIYIDPRDARRVYAAVSAGGVYRSDDGCASWKPVNRGIRADYLPDPSPESGHCVHRIVLHPARPDRLYQQSHTGTYRTDDRGENWIEITDGLPSDFGYAVATDPNDADTVFIVPEESSHIRTTVGGAITVYRSRNAGGDWQPLTRGLPRENAYVTVLREAIDTDGLDPCGVYFGTSSGHLFASRDGGESWKIIAGFLPRILCVEAAVIGG